MRRALLGVGLGVWLVACGSSSSDNGGPDGGGNTGGDGGLGPGPSADGGVDGTLPGTDGGGQGADASPDGGYACAPHSPIPAIKYWGGPILHTPEVVTITFDSLDATTRTELETFDDSIVTSQWWDDTLKGFCDKNGKCIQHGTSGGHVILHETPAATYTDSQTPGNPRSVVDFIQAHINAGTFPPPDPEILYTIYFPSSVTLTLDGAASCGFGGYHFAADFTLPSDAGAGEAGAGDAGTTTVRAAYALMPQCDTSSTAADSWRYVASHELIEAATDAKSLGPDVRNADWGYYMEDPAWGILFSGQEVGDLCGGYPTATVNGVQVTRGWRHDIGPCEVPCGPLAPGDTYYGAAPDQQIVTLAIGEEAVLNVTAFSQDPRADWTVAAVEPGDSGQFGITGYGGHLQFTWEGLPSDGGAAPEATVNNGTQLKLHVKLLSAPPEDQNFPDQTGARYHHAFAYLISKVSSTDAHRWPFTVRQKP
jgi:hypothetical protein